MFQIVAELVIKFLHLKSESSLTFWLKVTHWFVLHFIAEVKENKIQEVSKS